MPVTLQAAELIVPIGELDCDFFPDGNLDGRIGGWLSQAKIKVTANTLIKAEDQNEAAKAWTYYLAYSYLAGKYSSMPRSVSVNKGADSISYGAETPGYWAGRAALALAAYEGFVPSVVRTPKTSFAIPTKAVW